MPHQGRGPVGPTRWGARSSRSLADRPLEPADVLVVDNDASVRVTLAAILADVGHTVTECASGAEALVCLRDHEFDVILTDLRLEDMDGIRVLGEARRGRPD